MYKLQKFKFFTTRISHGTIWKILIHKVYQKHKSDVL
jgi:hypothetical protein